MHVLTLTATPIPRTLQLSLTGVKQLSIIATPPVDRLAARTFVMPFDKVMIKEAIYREKFRGGQIFFVCPRVSDIFEIERDLRALVPDVKILVAHGQMPVKQLESVMNDFADGKASLMGEYVPAALGMEPEETPVFMALTEDYKGYMLFFFDNGKCARVPMESYATKQNRKKLLKAYSDKAPLVQALQIREETELAIQTSAGRLLLVGTAQIPAKQTRDTAGVAVITLKKNQTITSIRPASEMELTNPHRYRVRTLPAAGALLRAEDTAEQMSF